MKVRLRICSHSVAVCDCNNLLQKSIDNGGMIVVADLLHNKSTP